MPGKRSLVAVNLSQGPAGSFIFIRDAGVCAATCALEMPQVGRRPRQASACPARSFRVVRSAGRKTPAAAEVYIGGEGPRPKPRQRARPCLGLQKPRPAC
jgi:hypothetical protein